MTEPSTADVFEREALDRIRQLTGPGEPDVLTEVLQIFRDDLPVRVTRLEAAAAAGDFVAVQRVAHSIKGSAGTVGARVLHAACLETEAAARSADAAAVAAAVRDVRVQVERAVVAIAGILA